MACTEYRQCATTPGKGPCISEVLMGLLAADGRCWESAPVPVPLVEVVDRLLEGDPIVAVRAGPGHPGARRPSLPAGAGQPPRRLGRMH